jgi:hypothetical protein
MFHIDTNSYLFLLAAVVSKLDQSVDDAVSALQTQAMLHNSIVLHVW